MQTRTKCHWDPRAEHRLCTLGYDLYIALVLFRKPRGAVAQKRLSEY